MLDERGGCAIRPWLAQVSTAGRANFDRAIEHLLPLPQQEWHKPHPASNIGDNIYVIRFRDENRAQLRVFGHARHHDHSFVMTLNGYEKDDTYYPKGYDRTTADNREICNRAHENRTIRCRYADEVCGEDVSDAEKFHLECRACFES